MKWLITSLLSVVLVYAAHAQPQTYRDQLTGLVHIINSDLEIEGTPFLFEDWIPATVKTRLDKYFYGVKVKFDVHQNKFLFNSNDTAYEFVTDIEYFELHPNTSDTTKKLIYKKGFSYANRLNATEYVQVLAEGKINVVKKVSKTIQEYQAYSKPTTQKKFVDDVAYFFISNGNATTNKPSKKILEELTKDKWEQVNNYLKSSGLNPKNEQDFAKIIQYYNGLN